MGVCCLGLLGWGGTRKKTFIHSQPSWSSDIPYHLPKCTMIHSIVLVQLTCLIVFFHNLSLGPLWSSSWSGTLYFILHTFLHPITCPYHHSLFRCSTNVTSSIPNLSLRSLFGNPSFALTPHIHLTILISARWSVTSFSFLTGQVSQL